MIQFPNERLAEARDVLAKAGLSLPDPWVETAMGIVKNVVVEQEDSMPTLQRAVDVLLRHCLQQAAANIRSRS